MKTLLAISFSILVAACEESQGSKDIRWEKNLKDAEKAAHEEYVRENNAAMKKAENEGSGGSFSGIGSGN